MTRTALLIGLTACLAVRLVASAEGSSVEAAVAKGRGFEFDASALQERPSGLQEVEALAGSAFAVDAIAESLLQAQASFESTKTVAGREFLQSDSWYLERNPGEGRILALRKPSAVKGAPQDPATLEASAVARLHAWGIPSIEMGIVLQRQLMGQDQELGEVEQPTLYRHKTFVFRTFDGVRVEGNRAVVTNNPDGSLQRVMIHWPPLAPSGHQLRSVLTVSEIVERARAAVSREGASEGPVTLQWKYVPSTQEDGSITLKLMVSARIAAAENEQHEDVDEPRLVDVPVDAF